MTGAPGINHDVGRFCRSRGQSAGFDLGRATRLDRIAFNGTLAEDCRAIRLDTREKNGPSEHCLSIALMGLAARAKCRVTNVPFRVFIRKTKYRLPELNTKTFQYLAVTN